MANYLSQYRSTFGLEKLEKNGDYDGRTITINVSDFGTIVSSVESSADARNNAMVFSIICFLLKGQKIKIVFRNFNLIQQRSQ